MPVHNWKKAPVGLFHHFHQDWSCEICRTLNRGLLPSRFYALIEQSGSKIVPDVLTLKRHSHSAKPERDGGGIAIAEAPPKTSLINKISPADVYAAKANKIVIRNKLGEVVSVIELVSPGNKHSKLQNDVHLLIVDLFPPTKRDPQGIHGLI